MQIHLSTYVHIYVLIVRLFILVRSEFFRVVLKFLFVECRFFQNFVWTMLFFHGEIVLESEVATV